MDRNEQEWTGMENENDLNVLSIVCECSSNEHEHRNSNARTTTVGCSEGTQSEKITEIALYLCFILAPQSLFLSQLQLSGIQLHCLGFSTALLLRFPQPLVFP